MEIKRRQRKSGRESRCGERVGGKVEGTQGRRSRKVK